MKIDRYLQHIPEIERRIRELRPDAIVWGLGPTAWLLPWIDQRLLRGVRKWTAHDGCRILPAHDLVIMDPPQKALNSDTHRYDEIVKSRPERIWIWPQAWVYTDDAGTERPMWKAHLNESVHSLVTVQPWGQWHPQSPPNVIKPKLGRLKNDVQHPDTFGISPTGTTTLAWAQGCRRIGIIGVDMLKEHGHTSYPYRAGADVFFSKIAEQAEEMGGCIRNLSPIASLPQFEALWTRSASSSEPTTGNVTPEPSASSNTASESTPLAPWSSNGSVQVIPVSRSASEATAEAGGST